MDIICWYFFVLTCYLPLSRLHASRGNKDITFYRCMQHCQETQCNGTEYHKQPALLQLLKWDCESECQYSCMWHTVSIFEEYGLEIPQFYGKWPFVRFAGIQEPASVLASIFNLAVHVAGILTLRKHISSNCPLYWFWHFFSVVCINGWVWSTIFHIRDTPLTEAMDYFSAFSLVLFSLFGGFVKSFEDHLSLQISSGVALFSFFVYHVYYLALVKFDYGYNMKANILIGVLNALCWILWCWRNRKTHTHIWKCVTFITLALASISLEILDFPPIYWTLDCHALWHFATAVITPLWYSFLLDDCRYQERAKMKIL